MGAPFLLIPLHACLQNFLILVAQMEKSLMATWLNIGLIAGKRPTTRTAMAMAIAMRLCLLIPAPNQRGMYKRRAIVMMIMLLYIRVHLTVTVMEKITTAMA